jgi:hypothetical protein
MARLALFLAAAVAALLALLVAPTSLPGLFAPLVASVALALAASAHLDALPLAAGALGSLTSVALLRLAPTGDTSVAAAGATLLAAAFLERTARVEGAPRRLAHLALAATSGALAALIFARHGAAAPLPRTAALVMGGALLTAPLLIPAEDPVAHLLSLAAGRLKGPTSPLLRGAAELRRWSLRPSASAPSSRRIDARWSALVALVHERLALPQPPSAAPGAPDSYRDTPTDEGPEARQARRLDEQIADACAALRQAHGQG